MALFTSVSLTRAIGSLILTHLIMRLAITYVCPFKIHLALQVQQVAQLLCVPLSQHPFWQWNAKAAVEWGQAQREIDPHQELIHPSPPLSLPLVFVLYRDRASNDQREIDPHRDHWGSMTQEPSLHQTDFVTDLMALLFWAFRTTALLGYFVPSHLPLIATDNKEL